MKKLLHIVASPRGEESRTLKISEAFIEGLRKKYPDCAIDTLNVFEEKLPDLTVKRIGGKYVLLAGKELPDDLKGAWKEIIEITERFLSSDAYLVSAPMWNFNIPYPLKHYIDLIVNPKYLFKYTPQGPEGLVKNRKMVVATSRGGDYSGGSPFKAYDQQEPYLRTVFGFVGITDITSINAQPMDALGPDVAKEKLEAAKAKARELGKVF